MANLDSVAGFNGGIPDDAARAVTAAPSMAKEYVFPLSFAQQRLWVLDRLLPMGSVYNVPKIYRLRGELELEALRGALDELVERHESLRTRFGFEGSGPVQLIAAQQRMALEVEDLRALAPGEREAEAKRRAQAEAQAPFDLERGPLIRGRLLRLGEREHWLLLTLHHIITDGWSSGVMARELTELYGARRRGEGARLPALPVQYADYAVWQREWFQGEVLEQQLGYWKPALAELPVLELPTDRPRPAVATFRGARLSFEIDAGLTRRLKELGRAERATLFMTLLAAHQVLLYRYSGQEDFAVGAPIAGRVRPELGGLIGFFVNTLVLRADLSGEPSFSEYLGRVRARALEAYAHQDLPFEKLVEELHPKRDLSRNPLFQVALALQNTPPGELALEGLEVEALSADELSTESAKFDLHFSVTEVGGVLRTRVEYALDLFDASTIERMVGHWKVLLEGIVADPTLPISRLPLLTPQEHHQIVRWNATAVDYPQDRCVHALFEDQVERTPEAPAVVCGEQRLSYAELNSRANRLAHHLRMLGVELEARVGVFLERSPALVVALLGILKAGAAYVPLDPRYPPQRVGSMLADSDAAVLVTQQSLEARARPTTSQVLCIDRDWDRVAQQPGTNPPSTAVAGNLAYVIYTSGSTGEPKGVMIEHASLVNHMRWMQRVFPLEAADAVLQKTPVSADASVWEFYAPLFAGARLVLAPADAHGSPIELTNAVMLHGITILQLVPTMFAAMLGDRSFERCASLRRVFCGGEPLSRDLVQRFAKQSRAQLVNLYGPTEVTIDATYWVCDAGDERRSTPIGLPIDNVTAHVLNGAQEPVPVGVVAELYLGGAGVGRGYWKRPELTRAAFVSDRSAAAASARLYRTGDIVRRHPDGLLEFLSRRDGQVKLRGFRIELAEIEAVLERQPGVAKAVVLVRDEHNGGPSLVAYVVPSSTPVAPKELQSALQRTLPHYMVPSMFVSLSSLPQTPNGKIDRTRLPAPGRESVVVSEQRGEPRDELERRLCAIWAQVLGVERVGPDDDFFALGGHSLLGARLFAQIGEEFGRALPLAILFDVPTVRKLAEHLRSSTPLDGCVSLVAINRSSARPPVFAVGGVGGNVIGFADLARALGPEQGFYALQSVGLDGSREPLTTIEAMAQLYVSEVRSVQPSGPYALIGACWGATVAYEMARQIAQTGQEVAFLGLLDPTRLGGEDAGRIGRGSRRPIGPAMTAGSFVMSRLQLYRRELAKFGPRGRIAYLAGKLRMLLRRASGRASLEGVRLEMNLMRVHQANVAALRGFVRKPMSGGVKMVAVFETPQRARARAGIDWGAGSTARVVSHIVSGGDSGDMLKGENARVLAANLAEQLKRAFEAQ